MNAELQYASFFADTFDYEAEAARYTRPTLVIPWVSDWELMKTDPENVFSEGGFKHDDHA